jgi:hypothetical protein
LTSGGIKSGAKTKRRTDCRRRGARLPRFARKSHSATGGHAMLQRQSSPQQDVVITSSATGPSGRASSDDASSDDASSDDASTGANTRGSNRLSLS